MQKTVIGLDPEIFVVNESGKIICPTIFAEPSKTFIPASTVSGGFNRDGMAIELNPSPDSDPRELARKTRGLLIEAEKKLRNKGARPIETIGANIFSDGDESTFAEDIMQGGCDPDFNAYTGQINVRNVDYTIYPFRFCGGHIHITAPFIRSFDEACGFIQNLRPLGEYLSQFEDNHWSKMRRTAYGQEGDFRWRSDKERIEYRTPDSSWMWAEFRSSKVMEEVFKIITNTINKFTTVGV